jgi:hypothetical protein
LASYVELKKYHPGLPLPPQFMTVILDMEMNECKILERKLLGKQQLRGLMMRISDNMTGS